MKSKALVLLLCIVAAWPQITNAQDYVGGRFTIKTYTHRDHTYTLYDFSRESNVIKAKYFAQNAYSQYINWKASKQILLVTAGAFSDSFTVNAKPVGLCVDNGVSVNKTPNQEMDGMVIIYNGGAQEGGVAVVDMDVNPVKVQEPIGSTTTVAYYPRSSSLDKVNFIKWGERNGVTLFQTQLVYSSDRYINFGNLNYGNKRERRFLATCKKGGIVHHIVVDAPDELELNLSASYVKEVLDYAGFNVLYIMNLDTGCKNILHVFNGRGLQNLNPSSTACRSDAQIERATNLLIYYKD